MCVPAEQAWEWSRGVGEPGPLPDPVPSSGGEGGVGNGGAGGDAGASGGAYPAGTCPQIQLIIDQLSPGAVTGFGSGTFNNGQCCYFWGVACG